MLTYKTQKSQKILRYLDSLRHGLRTFPPSLQVALTDYCYNKCIMCGHWKRKDKHVLDFGDYLDFLRPHKHLLETVCYSGGEPMLYPELNDLMYWHMAYDVDYGFITAGYVPENVDIPLLAKARWLRVSLDSVEAYEEVRGGSLSFEKVKESLFKLRDAGANVAFGITVHNKNILELESILAFVAAEFPNSELRVWPVRHEPQLELDSLQKKHMMHLLFNYGSIFPNNNFKDIQDILNRKVEPVEFDQCYACLLHLFITPDGGVHPCCILAGDSLNKQGSAMCHINDFDWQEILRFSSSTRLALPDRCSGCTLRLSLINKVCGDAWEDRHFV